MAEVSEYLRTHDLFMIYTSIPVDLGKVWESEPEKIAEIEAAGYDLPEIEEYEPDYSGDFEDTDYLNSYEQHYYEDEINANPYEGETLWMWECNIDDLGLYEYADYERADFDRWLFEEDLGNYIQTDAYKYLALGSGMGWRRLSGYKFFDTIENAIYRDYDISIYLQDSDFDGKILTYKESSHDVPMGASMTIIALDRDEYAALTNEYDEEWQEWVEVDPKPELVDKLLEQGHLDPEDYITE